jgi:hypothetical protein
MVVVVVVVVVQEWSGVREEALMCLGGVWGRPG